MIEELGIRLSQQGFVEATNGFNLMGNVIDALGRRLNSVIPAWLDAAKNTGQAGTAMEEAATAASGAGTAVSGLAVPLGVAAAATAVLYVAWSQGQREARGYATAITLTGNAAGTTADQMSEAARATSVLVGTQHQAAEAIAELLKSGRVGAEGMSQFAEVAIRMQRVTGQSVQETVRTFEALGHAPLQASIRLNEQVNFLTISTYEQIKSLVEQKRVSEAAAVAQKAYADVMNPRLVEIEGNLGFLETAWKAVGDKAAETWDKMLGIGREQTLQQKLAEVEARIATLKSKPLDPTNETDSWVIQYGGGADPGAELSKAEGVRALLQGQILNAEVRARQQADAAAAVRKRIAEDGDKPKRTSNAASAYESLNDEIARHSALTQAELDNEGKLSEAQRYRVEMLLKIAAAHKELGEAKSRELRGDVEAEARKIASLELQREALRQQEEVHRAFVADRQQATQAAEAEEAQILRANETLAAETAQLGLNSAQLYQRSQALNDLEIAEKQAHLARIEGLPYYTAEAAVLERSIAALQARRNLLGENFVKATQTEEAKANQERTDAIAASIEDGILDGFRGSRKIADVFLSELKAQFARTVLRVPIQMLAQSGADMAGSLGKLLQLAMVPGVGLGSNPAGFNGTLNNLSAYVPIPGSHEGGVPGLGEATFFRAMPTRAFAGAPRFHSGIGPDELPAILTKKEGVFTEGQMKAMAPVSEISKAGGRTLVYSPTFNIDSRTDKAEIMGLIDRAGRAMQADLLDKMNRGQV